MRNVQGATGKHLGITELEDKTEMLDMKHGTFSRKMRNRLKQAFDAPLNLMTVPDPLMRHIGFINPEDQGKKISSRAKRKT